MLYGLVTNLWVVLSNMRLPLASSQAAGRAMSHFVTKPHQAISCSIFILLVNFSRGLPRSLPRLISISFNRCQSVQVTTLAEERLQVA
jgi:hypothetical protein